MLFGSISPQRLSSLYISKVHKKTRTLTSADGSSADGSKLAIGYNHRISKKDFAALAYIAVLVNEYVRLGEYLEYLAGENLKQHIVYAESYAL